MLEFVCIAHDQRGLEGCCMAKKSYRFLWWLLIILVLGGVIWYAVWSGQEQEYKNGTLVMEYFDGWQETPYREV